MVIKAGHVETFQRSFSQRDFSRFADLTGDNNPIHVDPEFSARTRFGRSVAHGMLLYSTICRMLSTQFPGPGLLQIRHEMMFQNPTYADPKNLDSKLMFFQVADPEVLSEYLYGRWASALAQTAKQVLADRLPDYLALRHLSTADRRRVIDELQIKSESSIPLSEWGHHHGPNDVIISLDLGLKSGIIRDGSSVALVSAGIGFTYAAALVQWGGG